MTLCIFFYQSEETASFIIITVFVFVSESQRIAVIDQLLRPKHFEIFTKKASLHCEAADDFELARTDRRRCPLLLR